MRKKTEKVIQNIQEMWNNYKKCNIHVMEIQGKERQKRTEEIFETLMTENLPKLISAI